MPVSLKPSTAQVNVGSLGGTALSLLHSVRTRGLQRTAIFAGLGLGLPMAAELIGVNGSRALRHHTRPQLLGVPVPVVLAWYNVTYPTFVVVEQIARELGLPVSQDRWALPLGTAAVATSLDLLLDCYGLDQGLWEWTEDGSYARDITGPNGKQGIPIANFVGWIVLTSAVTGSYVALTTPGNEAEVVNSSASGHTAALLLLPYYALGLAWAMIRRKPRYLLPSALVPIAIGVVLASKREE